MENETNTGGSTLLDTGMPYPVGSRKTVIQVTALDECLPDEPVTFIKMDIEGSELKALEGARKTIERNHPKMTNGQFRI